MNRFNLFILCLLLSIVPGSLAAQSQNASMAIYFGLNKDYPLAGEWKKLDSLLAELPPQTPLSLIGHTDYQASSQYNLALSQRRTESVRQYLMNKGIAAEIISTRWEGENAPATTETTPKGLQLNRRVEISWAMKEETKPRRNGSEFVFLAEIGLDTVTEDGVKINIAPNSLQNNAGQSVKGEVRLQFKNYRDKIDQLEAGFSLDFEKAGKWYLYNSAGMFSIFAYQNQDTLSLREGQTIRIEYPLLREDLNLSFFKYIAVEKNWREEAMLPKNPGETQDIPQNNPNPVQETPTPHSDPNANPTPPNHSESPLKTDGQKPTALSLSDTLGTDEPDSLGLDTLSGQRLPLPVTDAPDTNFCATCNCVSGHLLFALTVQPDIPPRTNSSLDFYSLFSGYPNELLEQIPYCTQITIKWEPIPQSKKKGVIAATVMGQTFPFYDLLQWKLLNGAQKRKRSNWQHAKFQDIMVLGNPFRRGVKLVFKRGLTTETYRAKLIPPISNAPSARSSKKETKAYLAQLYAQAQQEATLTYQKTFKEWLLASRECTGLVQTALRDIQSLAQWNRIPKDSTYSNVWRYLETCYPSGCCPKDKIIDFDSVSFRLPKVVIAEGGAIPIVLLDDFGIFNWDAVDTLPNPIELLVIFQDEKGLPVPAFRSYLLVSGINGIIRLPYQGKTGNIKYSPAVTNHFLIIGQNGEVYYSTDKEFRAAVKQGGNPIRIPCVTIPHTIGDPPVNLREILPFE